MKRATIIGLIGDLGAGKTTFVQDFAKELGIKERVISPTFVIMKVYSIQPIVARHLKFKNLIHIDAYRLDSAEDMCLLGWEEMIKNPENIIMIEWADRVRHILPKERIDIFFEHQKDGGRKISVKSKFKNQNGK